MAETILVWVTGYRSAFGTAYIESFGASGIKTTLNIKHALVFNSERLAQFFVSCLPHIDARNAIVLPWTLIIE